LISQGVEAGGFGAGLVGADLRDAHTFNRPAPEGLFAALRQLSLTEQRGGH